MKRSRCEAIRYRDATVAYLRIRNPFHAIKGQSKRLVATVRWSTVERMPHFDDTAELLLAAILAR